MGELIDLQEYKTKKDEEEIQRLREQLEVLKQQLEHELTEFAFDVYSNTDVHDPNYLTEFMLSPLLLDALGDGEEFETNGEE